MNEAEMQSIILRLIELGVDADWATSQAASVGKQCQASGINLKTLLLFALTVASGCRSGLDAEVAREIEELHNKAEADHDRKMNEGRS
jgi:hypothetical protein